MDNNLLDNASLAEQDLCTEENLGTPEEALESEEAYRVFKTQQDFQACIDKAMGKRLSKMREQGERIKSLEETVSLAFEKFGVDSNEGLLSALEDFENVQNSSQEEISSEVETLSTELASALNKELENLFKSGGVYKNGQSDSLLADERFLSLIKSGFSVKEAYDALNLNEILECERQRVIREIRLRGLRPEEDAISGYGSFSATLDPKNLTQAQRAEIRERVRRGERVTF